MKLITFKATLYFISFIIPFLTEISSIQKIGAIRLGQNIDTINNNGLMNQRMVMEQLNYNNSSYIHNVNNNLPNELAITNGATAKQLLRKSKKDSSIVTETPTTETITSATTKTTDTMNDNDYVQLQDHSIASPAEQNAVFNDNANSDNNEKENNNNANGGSNDENNDSINSNIQKENLSSYEKTVTYYNDNNDVENKGMSVPNKFQEDRMLLNGNDPKRRSYPRWDFGNDNNNNVPIIDSMIDFIRQESTYFQRYLENPDTWFDLSRNNPIHTSDHIYEYTPNWWFPEALYIVDFSTFMTAPLNIENNGNNSNVGRGRIYASQTARTLSDHGTGAIQYKYHPTEELMKLAMDIFVSSSCEQQQQSQQHPWPRLYELLIRNKGSFPFLAHYSDFIGCNHNNWGETNKQSIPLFTVAANVECNHTIPFPTYRMFLRAFEDKYEWMERMEQYATTYPKFEEKINQVVWRGSLTGVMPQYNVSQRGPRYHLTKLVHNENVLTEEQRNMFNVKLTHIPNDNKCAKYINGTELGGISNANKMNMQEDFQNYKVIIDVDGFSWSSRYSDLLCYNSVILKIEPQYVDYFYYPSKNTNRNDNDDDYTLLPWKQFIPVKFDLSDLVEKAQYALDSKNEKHMQQIIHNANEWCMNKFTRESLGRDVLDIWEKYVTILDQSSSLSLSSSNNNNDNLHEQQQVEERILDGTMNNNNYMHWEEHWNQAKDEILSSPLQMVVL